MFKRIMKSIDDKVNQVRIWYVWCNELFSRVSEQLASFWFDFKILYYTDNLNKTIDVFHGSQSFILVKESR